MSVEEAKKKAAFMAVDEFVTANMVWFVKFLNLFHLNFFLKTLKLIKNKWKRN